MTILLDENVDNRVREVLESEGFEVSTVYEEDLIGSKDRTIADYCIDKDFAVMTHDDDFLSIQQEKTDLKVVYIPQVIGFKQMKERVKDLETEKLENSSTVYL